MEQCIDYVNFQIINRQIRINHALDDVVRSNAGLDATMAITRNDKMPSGKLSDFELEDKYLLQYDLVVKRKYIKGHNYNNFLSLTSLLLYRPYQLEPNVL